MTDTIINFSTNQSASNLLLSESDSQTLIDASVLAAIPTFSNATNYLAGEKVYYLGIFYVAPVNINLGGGTPLANTTWRQIPTWGSYTTTATAAGTTTLDLYSSEIQRFSGVTTQTVVLPVVTTLTALGKPFYFINDSTGTVTVNSSGGNLVATILGGQRVLINNILLTGTTAASWTVSNIDATVGLALKANIASPTFTGTVTVPTPFTLGATSVTATGTELNYVSGVTSAIQTQINTKAPTASPTFTGTVAMNGDLQLAENVSILLDAALSADGKWSGICESGVIGDTTVLFGELLYFKAADSRWWRCDADAEATSGPVKLGVCVVAGTAGDTRTIMLKGKINAASLYPTLTIGAPAYIGATAGNIQVASPTSGFVRVVGYGNTADELYFDPSSEYYELGTWTCGVSFGNGTTGITYASRNAIYRKEHGICEFWYYYGLSSKGSSTGASRVTGLPFTISGTNLYSCDIVGNPTLVNGLNCYMEGATTTLRPVTSGYSNIADTAYSNSTEMNGHGRFTI